MTDRIREVAVLGVLGALGAAPALAADPAADARYAGQTSQGKLRFEFATSADGTQLVGLLTQFKAPHCANARSRAQGELRPRTISVRGGAFSARGKETEKLKAQGDFDGGTQIERYVIKGGFPTADEARGTLKVTVEIRDKQGETLSTCRHKKPVTWSADRLGLGPETEE